jgi:hypothetical protein
LSRIAGLSVLALVGCKSLYPAASHAPRSYLAIVYRAHAATEPKTTSEVHQADKFPALLETWKTAAVRAPDSCANDASSCGAWLSQIERGLVERKFAVVSSTAVRDVERAKHVPAHAAAHELGADVVFIINELDARAVPMGNDARETFDVFETDEEGRDRRPPAVAESNLDAATTFAKKEVTSLRPELAKTPTHLLATLDVTAVDANTGEAVWFYQRREVSPVSFEVERDFMIATEGESWWPTYPHRLRGTDPAPAAPTASAFAEQSQALSRGVVTDFLSHIRGG